MLTKRETLNTLVGKKIVIDESLRSDDSGAGISLIVLSTDPDGGYDIIKEVGDELFAATHYHYGGGTQRNLYSIAHIIKISEP